LDRVGFSEVFVSSKTSLGEAISSDFMERVSNLETVTKQEDPPYITGAFRRIGLNDPEILVEEDAKPANSSSKKQKVEKAI